MCRSHSVWTTVLLSRTPESSDILSKGGMSVVYCGLTVHWDGKLMGDLLSSKTVDRLAILVSGQGVKHLSSSSECQAFLQELGKLRLNQR